MTYSEAVDYILDIPKFTKKNDAAHTKAFLKTLGDPQRKMRIIHVAGTNGKGSVFTFVQNVLLQAGYHVGRYASPAVFEYREIIQFDGKNITEEELKVLKEESGL